MAQENKVSFFEGGVNSQEHYISGEEKKMGFPQS
jgi:hypothetical protein